MLQGKRAWKSLVLVSACSLLVLASGCDKTMSGDKTTTEKAAPENATSRVNFDQLFNVNGNTVTPKKVIRFGSTTMSPEVPFESNVMMIDNAAFSQYIGHDAEVKKSGDVTEIIRFY